MLSIVLYFGKIEGENNLRKLKAWLAKEYIQEVKSLPTGSFIVQHGDQIDIEEIPLFQSRIRPQLYIEPQPIKKIVFWSRLLRVY